MPERTKTCRFHCRSCGCHFASERAFDWHRRGPWDARRCESPRDDEKRRFEARAGACHISVPDGAEPVAAEIWSV